MSNVAEFEGLCCDYAGWWRAGFLEKAVALDCVQRHAELWGVVDEIGQDEVQRMMAEAFMPVPELPPAGSIVGLGRTKLSWLQR